MRIMTGLKRRIWKVFRYFSCWILLTVFPAGALPATTSATLAINEFMADNKTTAADQDGEYDDWIELFNNSGNDISLSGYYLTDKSTNLTKWAFPDTTIPAGGYLIVWADEEVDQAELHADFRLSASGETILLVASDQTIIDEVTFGEQQIDISMARYPNGIGDFIEMSPTFSAVNTGSADMDGDIDGNSSVDLEDAVLALLVINGKTTDSTVQS